MASPIHHMTTIRYYRDGRHWDTERINSPSWQDVEAAVRRMDNYCFPIVELNTTESDEKREPFQYLWRCRPLGTFPDHGGLAI